MTSANLKIGKFAALGAVAIHDELRNESTFGAHGSLCTLRLIIQPGTGLRPFSISQYAALAQCL